MEYGYKIIAKDKDGKFITYQRGFNRLHVVTELMRYHQPFKLISVTPL